MNIKLLFGTESGNAELVAEDLAEILRERGEDAETIDMSQGAVPLTPEEFYIVICSTHGEGELPVGALPFAEWLDTSHPDLSGIRYAVFGLGDSSYPKYSQGSEHIDSRLTARSARRLGSYGRHDANSRNTASDIAAVWLEDILSGAFISP